jgi:hypothetical protein
MMTTMLGLPVGAASAIPHISIDTAKKSELKSRPNVVFILSLPSELFVELVECTGRICRQSAHPSSLPLPLPAIAPNGSLLLLSVTASGRGCVKTPNRDNAN